MPFVEFLGMALYKKEKNEELEFQRQHEAARRR
jgi:hypothetical protein